MNYAVKKVMRKHSTSFRSVLWGQSFAPTRPTRGFHSEESGHPAGSGQSALELCWGNPLPGAGALRTGNGHLSSSRSKTIVVPFYENEESLRFLHSMTRMLRLNGSEVHLLLVHKERLPEAAKTKLFSTKGNNEIERRAGAEQMFAVADAMLSVSGAITRARHMLEGDPAVCILEYSDRVHADLIAMVCRGFTRAQRILMRESSQQVADRANRPVLLFRVPELEDDCQEQTMYAVMG